MISTFTVATTIQKARRNTPVAFGSLYRDGLHIDALHYPGEHAPIVLEDHTVAGCVVLERDTTLHFVQMLQACACRLKNYAQVFT